jgi:hypothetical protein
VFSAYNETGRLKTIHHYTPLKGFGKVRGKVYLIEEL